MRSTLFKALAVLAVVASPVLAEAATRGYSTANVNMRSGPSTAYPAVVVVPNGANVTIHGCLQDRPWCDVSFRGGRGWVAGRYVQAEYRSNRVYVEPQRYPDLGVPVITFEVGRYWDQNYRGRDFYRERDRWRRPASGGYWDAAPPPPRRDMAPPPPRDRRDPSWQRQGNNDDWQQPRPDRRRVEDNRRPDEYRDDAPRTRRDNNRGPQFERGAPPRDGWPCPPGQDCRMP